MLGPSPDTSITLRGLRKPLFANRSFAADNAPEIDVPRPSVNDSAASLSAKVRASSRLSTIVHGTMTVC